MSRLSTAIGLVWVLATSPAFSQEWVAPGEAICTVSWDVREHVNMLLDIWCLFNSAPYNPTPEEVDFYNWNQAAYFYSQIQCQSAMQEVAVYMLEVDWISDMCRDHLEMSRAQISGMLDILRLQRDYLGPEKTLVDPEEVLVSEKQ